MRQAGADGGPEAQARPTFLAALNYREHTGRGQLVELAQSENVLNHLGDVFIAEQLGVPASRAGNRDRSRAPQGLYPCQDGVVLAISEPADDISATPYLVKDPLGVARRLAPLLNRPQAQILTELNERGGFVQAGL